MTDPRPFDNSNDLPGTAEEADELLGDDIIAALLASSTTYADVANLKMQQSQQEDAADCRRRAFNCRRFAQWMRDRLVDMKIPPN